MPRWNMYEHSKHLRFVSPVMSRRFAFNASHTLIRDMALGDVKPFSQLRIVLCPTPHLLLISETESPFSCMILSKFSRIELSISLSRLIGTSNHV